jgi:hypothetical protein
MTCLEAFRLSHEAVTFDRGVYVPAVALCMVVMTNAGRLRHPNKVAFMIAALLVTHFVGLGMSTLCVPWVGRAGHAVLCE